MHLVKNIVFKDISGLQLVRWEINAMCFMKDARPRLKGAFSDLGHANLTIIHEEDA